MKAPEPTDREKATKWAKRIIPFTNVIWLDGVSSSEADVLLASAGLNSLLQEALSQAADLSTHELLMIIRASFSCRERLPMWPVLLAQIQTVLTTRDPERVDSLLMGLT